MKDVRDLVRVKPLEFDVHGSADDGVGDFYDVMCFGENWIPRFGARPITLSFFSNRYDAIAACRIHYEHRIYSLLEAK